MTLRSHDNETISVWFSPATGKIERVDTPDTGTPMEAVEAMRNEHRVELGKLHMRLVKYRELLEAHGIDPPDYDDDELLEMWRDCRAVISTASSFVSNLRSAAELL